MKKALYIILALVLASSCKAMIDPLRVQMEGTYWSYSKDSQTARVCFQDDSHISILQYDGKSDYVQSTHGTYYTDGHAVVCNGEDWSNSVKFVRTFSNLKNSSTNRNLTSISPSSYKTIEGTVWASMINRNLNIAFFRNDGTCLEGIFSNTVHEEGLPSGWAWNKKDYTHTGNQVEAGPFKGTLYDIIMVVDTLAVMRANPVPGSSGTSALTGTAWTYVTSSFPGVILFTSDTEFTRILVGSKIIHEAKSGTYKLEGTTVTMTLDDKTETCQLEAGRFRFFDRTYEKVTLP